MQVALDSSLLILLFSFCHRWAVSSVMTRQNQIPTEDGSRVTLALIPLWDMCNHTNGLVKIFSGVWVWRLLSFWVDVRLGFCSPCQLPPGGQAEANLAASCLPVVEAVYLLHTENQECQSYATLRNYSDCTVFSKITALAITFIFLYYWIVDWTNHFPFLFSTSMGLLKKTFHLFDFLSYSRFSPLCWLFYPLSHSVPRLLWLPTLLRSPCVRGRIVC